MTVTIDATSALLRSAGVKSYTYHLVRALRKLAAPDQIRAFPFLSDFGSLDHQGSTLGRWGTLSRIALLYASRSTLLLDVLLAGTDIFHASNQIRRAPRGVKLTATVHDLTCWLMPQFHTEGNIRADRNFAKKILRKADGLIAVSENTRRDAIRLLRIAPERIETIHSGVAEEYFDAQPVKRDRPYVLYVGTIEPRKNLDTLLQAWKLLRPELRTQFELVIAGPQRLGLGKNPGAPRGRSHVSRLCAGIRAAGPDRRRDGVRLSVAVRRFRIPGGAGYGGGRAGGHVEHLFAAGNRGRRRDSGGPAKRLGNRSRHRAIARIGEPARESRRARPRAR